MNDLRDYRFHVHKLPAEFRTANFEGFPYRLQVSQAR